MTLGDGIFASTVVVLLFAGIYLTTRHRKWKAVGKRLLILLGIAALGTGAILGYAAFRERAQVAHDLADVRIGMTPVEVTVAKGKPAIESKSEGTPGLTYLYDKPRLEVHFAVMDGALKAVLVCEREGYSRVQNFSHFSSESDVLEKLGEPSLVSVDAKGLRKLISFEKWRSSFVIEKGSVSEVCVSASGRLRFVQEYGQRRDMPFEAGAQESRYVVQSGDSIFTISMRHKLSVQSLIDRNQLDRRTPLKSGQVLFLDGVEVLAPLRTIEPAP